MGIPVYFSHIIREHSSILKKINQKQNNFDIFFFDANSIIYDSYYLNKDNYNNHNHDFIESDIIKNSIEKIKNILNLFHIQTEVVICLDGVAPLSKLNQQKQRRFKSVITKHITNKKENWNTCAITPGTNFMSKLNKQLKIFSENHNYNFNIIVLDSNHNGEGEQKIFNYIRSKYKINLTNYKNIINKNICIYGLDSDLIMLSLLHSFSIRNIYLYRDTPDFIKQINNKLDPNTNYIIDIHKLGVQLQDKLYPNNITTYNNEYIYNDSVIQYVILFFLLCNDFIPHIPSLSIRHNAIDRIIDTFHNIQPTYNKNKLLFTIKNNNFFIVWSNLSQILYSLSKFEFEDMKYIQTNKYDYQKKLLSNYKNSNNTEDILNNLCVFNTDEEDYILYNSKTYKNKYYELYYPDINIKNISHEYFKNLLWVLQYYTGGDYCDYTYYYPYYITPLLSDLIKYLPYKNDNILRNNSANYYFINPITQLLFVLPSDYYYLIPNQYYNNIDKYNKINNIDILNTLFNNFQKNINSVHYGFHKYFFESVIEFKYINIMAVDNIIKKII